MTQRMSGAVIVRPHDYREFLRTFREGALHNPVEGVVATHTRRVVDGTVTDFTSRTAGPISAITVSARPVESVVTPDPEADERIGQIVAVGLDTGDHRLLGPDILAAAGLDREVAVDLLTRMPMAPHAWAPNVPWELRRGLDYWMGPGVPSVLILARTEHKNDKSAALKLAESSIPRALRHVISVLAIREHVAPACNAFLASHDIAPLRDETMVVLLRTRTTLVELYRVVKPTIVGRNSVGRQAAAATREGMLRAAIALDEYYSLTTLRIVNEPAESTTEHERQLATLTANHALEQAQRERAEARLLQAERRIRHLEFEIDQLERVHDTTGPTTAVRGEAPTQEDTNDSPTPVNTDPSVRESEFHTELREQEFASFRALLSAARDNLSYLDLPDTLDDTALVLDKHSKAPIWRTRTWLALVLLDEFACTRAADGLSTPTVRDFAAAHPDPRISPARIVIGESGWTSGQRELRRARTFPVPKEVDSSGEAFFGPHVRIEPGRTRPTPRLHFLDDTAGTGRMYVGYLGAHLPSRRHGA